MSSLAVVLNPAAKKLRADPRLIGRLRAITAPHGELYECATLETLARAVDVIARDGIQNVAIAGGDGTRSMVLTALHQRLGERELPRITLLRAGTMNTIANSLGLPRERPDATLRRLVENLARGMPLRTVERRSLDAAGRLGFLFGTGAIYGFLDEYYRAGRGWPTPWTAAQTLLRGSMSALVGGPTVRRIVKPFESALRVDHEVWPRRKYLLFGVGTVDEIGLGFRPFYLAQGVQDAMHVLGIHASPAGFVSALPRIRLGRSLGARRAREALAREVTFDPLEGERIEYMVDGDLLTSDGPMTVRLGPSVQFVV